MDFQDIELTAENVLEMHRIYITKLFVVDRLSEVEIVQELDSKNSFTVTVSQIRRCIQDWNLLPLRLSTNSSSPSRLATSSSLSGITSQYLQNNTATRLPNPMVVPRTVPSADYSELYVNRPLPDLPPARSRTPSPDWSMDNNYTVSSSPSVSLPKAGSSSQSDTVVTANNSHNDPPETPTVTATNGQDESQESYPSVQVQDLTTLFTLPSGPSPLESYTDTEHKHERLAIGLGSEDDEHFGTEIILGIRWRRVRDEWAARGKVRRMANIRTRKENREKGRKGSREGRERERDDNV